MTNLTRFLLMSVILTPICQAKDIGNQLDPADLRTIITYTDEPCPIPQALQRNYLYAYKVNGEFMGCVSQEVDTGAVIFFRKDGVMFKHSRQVLDWANTRYFIGSIPLPNIPTPPSLTQPPIQNPTIQCFGNGFGTITCSSF